MIETVNQFTARPPSGGYAVTSINGVTIMNPYDNNPFETTPRDATPARESRSEYTANRSMRQAVDTRLALFNAALDCIARRERATR